MKQLKHRMSCVYILCFFHILVLIGGRFMKLIPKPFRNWLSRYGQLPVDVVYDYPRVTMIGQLHLYIENHHGLSHFSNQEIIINQQQYQMVVTGRDLVIKNLLKEEIVIEGQIENVSWRSPSNI